MPSILNATTTNGVTVQGDNSGSLQLATNSGTTALTIDTSQRVGISTTSPATQLDVRGAGSGTFGAYNDPLNVKGTDYTLLYINGTNGVAATIYSYNASNGWYVGTNNSASYRIGYMSSIDQAGVSNAKDGSSGLIITTGGQLYVGATSTVFTNDTTGGSFQGSQTGGGKPILEVINTSTSSSADGCPAIIAAKGSSTTSSSARFIQFSASSAAQPMGGIVGNGATNCQFASISDAREKTNIQEISGSLEKIKALKPVEFDWIRDNSHVNAGFVAQDVQNVFPEFVVDNMSDEGQEQRYGLTGGMTGGIIAHLVKAIQELKAELDATKAEVAALKGVA